MEDNNEEKKKQTILRQEDISQIIKHFSFTIQQRFEEIQKNYSYFTCLNSIIYDQSEIEKLILRKYNDYKTSDQQEIKLLQKFVERLLQIFEFFKQKTDESQILQQMSQQITQKLNQIVQNQTNHHFFVKNQPKTNTSNIKSFASRTQSNDFLSINPGCQRNKFDLAQIIGNNKKLNTESSQKRVIQVGKLFKYVFSILKRGYLVKLRMQKPQKKHRITNKENIIKGDESSMTISVEGTCALLRNFSQKGNKESIESQVEKVLSFGRDRLLVDPLAVVNQNKRQFQISQKVKSRSISTNQYSFLSSHNPSSLKQSTSNIRQLDRKLNSLYDILGIEKYSIVRIAKEPQGCKKDQMKRNLFIENESKKYFAEYRKWKQNDKRILKCVQTKNKTQSQVTYLNHNQVESLKVGKKLNEQAKTLQVATYQEQNYNLNIEEGKPTIFSDLPNKIINFKTQPNLNDHHRLSSIQHSQTSNQCVFLPSSRLCSEFANNSLADKPFNQNIILDKPSNLIAFNLHPNIRDASSSRSKSMSSKQKKYLKLDLSNMYSNNFNWPNDSSISYQNHTETTNKLSEKSQYYLQNYHNETDDDAVFIPLLPRKDKNQQNLNQTKRGIFSANKRNILSFHPLNRCRLFRQKKLVRNSIMVPSMELNEDLKSKGRVKNDIN